MRPFAGIYSRRTRRILAGISAELRRRHLDPRDSYQLPHYRHPLARERARRKRLAGQ